MKIIKFKIYEYFFLLSGLGVIVSLPWIENWSLPLWTAAKFSYFIGIYFFIKDLRKN